MEEKISLYTCRTNISLVHEEYNSNIKMKENKNLEMS